MRSSVSSFCVDPKQAHEVWPKVAHLILPAMEFAEEYRQVEAHVLAGRSLLWIVAAERTFIAAVVTDLTQIDGEKYCEIVACGGTGLERWLPFIGRLEQYARDENCKAVRIIGRPGWTRLLGDYRAKRVTMEKEL